MDWRPPFAARLAVPSFRLLSLQTACLLLLLCSYLGCKVAPPDTSLESKTEGTTTALFSISAGDILASPGYSSAPASRVSALGFSFQDVTSVRIDVREAGASMPLFRGLDLTREPGGPWTGRLPFLPKNKPLTFIATASSASGTELFRGSTDETLTDDASSVSIALSPANDGASAVLPRLQRITLPAQLFPGQSVTLHFLVEARAGERLDYVIDDGVNSGPGGGFSPSQGTLFLEGTSATFVIRYTAPDVFSATDFSHSVRLTNQDGNSLLSTFRTHVRPPSSDGVRDTSLAIFFNPVINVLSAARVPGAPQVTFEASLSDDRPLSELSYTWGFIPDGIYDPPPSFVPHQANPTTLQGYTLDVRGTLRLDVTDADGGRTTLLYALARQQFPDNPIVDNGFSSLLAGEGHTCVLLSGGALRCWGRNNWGQLGYGTTSNLGDDELPANAGTIPLMEIGDRLAVGGHHTCVLLDSGMVRCWGRNDSGQLGYGHTRSLGDNEAASSSGYVNLGGRAIRLVAGDAHTCALLETGKVRCWGRNDSGQLGYGHTHTLGDDEQPWHAGDVNVGGSVRELAAGARHTCALLTTGAVRCWGRNDSGQLGLGHTRSIGDDEVPASTSEVDVGAPVVQLSISSTSQHTCVRLSTGSVRCWGSNVSGQLGYGHNRPIGDDESPAKAGSVSMGGTVLQVATGSMHTCALLSTGGIKCWGRNESGQLGYGYTAPLSAPPEATVDLGGATAFQVAVGAWHTCALLASGEPRCWGRNTYGQLGLGNTYNLGDDETPASSPLTISRPPVLVETSQSPAAGGAFTLRGQAMDPQGSRLSFSWTATAGTLSTPSATDDTSEVVWKAPTDCISTKVSIHVRNALGLSAEHTFLFVPDAECRADCIHPSAATLNSRALAGLFDIQFDKQCNAYLSTIIGGQDYIYKVDPAGGVNVMTGYSNYNIPAIALTPSSAKLVVSQNDNSTSSVGVLSGTRIMPMATGNYVSGNLWSNYYLNQCQSSIAADDNGCAWIPNFLGNGSLVCVNVDNGAKRQLTKLPGRIEGIVLDGSGALLVSVGGDILSVNAATGATAVRYSAPAGILDFAMDANGDLYAETVAGKIMRVTAAGDVSTFAIVSGQGKLAISPDRFLVRLIPSSQFQEWRLGH